MAHAERNRTKNQRSGSDPSSRVAQLQRNRLHSAGRRDHGSAQFIHITQHSVLQHVPRVSNELAPNTCANGTSHGEPPPRNRLS
jgi:hypothetical protein